MVVQGIIISNNTGMNMKMPRKLYMYFSFNKFNIYFMVLLHDFSVQVILLKCYLPSASSDTLFINTIPLSLAIPSHSHSKVLSFYS